MHFPDSESVLAFLDNVIPGFIPQRCSCKPWTQEFGKRTEIESIGETDDTVDCDSEPESHDPWQIQVPNKHTIDFVVFLTVKVGSQILAAAKHNMFCSCLIP